MAKVDGIVEIQGTVKGITFYRTKYGMYARAKGGISKKRMKTDPAFERTRENCVEFGHNAKMGKLVRNAVSNLLLLAKDSRVSSRLAQTMSQIKNLDLVSVRGQRQVGIGIQTVDGKKILKGFDFNIGSPMGAVFKGILDLDPVSGVVVLADFNPAYHLVVPEGVTHVSLGTAISVVDFQEGVYNSCFSNTENFGVATATASYTFIPSEVPSGSGIAIYFFLIEFFQEINGVQYSLKNNSYNVLSILEVV
jgi:hypothetical protein